jgi:DNA-binding CsgD family transcriptional regulator
VNGQRGAAVREERLAMGRAGISALAELAYAAALDVSLWWRWGEEMIAGFGVQGALFWVIDTKRSEMCRSSFHFEVADPEMLAAEYLATQVEHDPQMKRVLSAQRSEIYSDFDHVDLDLPEDRNYVAWQTSRTGTSHHLTAAARLGDTLRAGIALHSSPQAGPATAAQRERLAALFPHLRRALRLGLRHSELLESAWWDGVEERDAHASLLLDEHGQILRISAAGERLFAKSDGITAVSARLQATDADSDSRLQAVIAHAVRERDGRASATTVGRRSGRRPYQVLIYPLVRRRRFLAPYNAAALVRIIDPCRIGSRLSDLQRELFRLSERETDVANLLLAGHSPESLAAVLDISPNTARIHIRSLFRKTGANRQSELIRLLLATV